MTLSTVQVRGVSIVSEIAVCYTINIVGLMPQTVRGNKYILTVVDHFRKHVKAYPLSDQKLTSIAHVSLNKFIARFGVCYVVHTDKSANFKSTLMKQLCKVFGNC